MGRLLYYAPNKIYSSELLFHSPLAALSGQRRPPIKTAVRGVYEDVHSLGGTARCCQCCSAGWRYMMLQFTWPTRRGTAIASVASIQQQLAHPASVARASHYQSQDSRDCWSCSRFAAPSPLPAWRNGPPSHNSEVVQELDCSVVEVHSRRQDPSVSAAFPSRHSTLFRLRG
jgi:hypothetical protein